MRLSVARKGAFQKIVLDFYHVNKRETLPWRTKINAYRVWVSEIMLQQTQVDRVIPFFNAWMQQFPGAQKLAEASQVDILRAWKGLGYNSRALRMKRTAEIITKDLKGKFPKAYDDLVKLPGIGPYTAGAICAFAYDQKQVFIETNIRRVFIHHFFKNQRSVHDRDILQLVEQTLPENNFRQWYFALMDYGSFLGKTEKVNPNKKSRHYTKQSQFAGSDRQIRGKILEILLQQKNRNSSVEMLAKTLNEFSRDLERIEMIISGLEKDGFVEVKKGRVWLKK